MSTATENRAASHISNLPVELLDTVTAYLPTASSVASLGQTSKSLHTYVERDGWKSFSRHRFPSQHPSDATSYGPVARGLTSLSRSWDRLAFVGRDVEITGRIHAFPGNRQIKEWTEPEGQTIGYAPKLDAFEETGSSCYDRSEILAFNAGAELCLRETSPGKDPIWRTYRPPPAREGRDDVTTLHLLRPSASQSESKRSVIVGTANGDLRIITFPDLTSETSDTDTTAFATEGSSVESASLHQQPESQALLAASLAYTTLALYPVDVESPAPIEPLSKITISPPSDMDGTLRRSHRIWSTSFLSATTLALGTGNCSHPIQVFAVTPSGIQSTPLRTYTLKHPSSSSQAQPAGPHMSTVHTLTPLTHHASPGQLFLSGANDGIVRLHDLRAPLASVQTTYDDPGDRSPIYSLLPRGHKLFVGMSRDSRMKVFDLRVGTKCYDYLDAARAAGPTPAPAASQPPIHPPAVQQEAPEINGSAQGPSSLRDSSTVAQLGSDGDSCGGSGGATVFVRRALNAREARAQRGAAPGGWRRRLRTPAVGNSSVYSLASPSPLSPYVYAGLEGGVVALAFTSVLDRHPDPTLFAQRERGGKGEGREDEELRGCPWPAKKVLALAMYEHERPLQLWKQLGVEETSQRPRSVGGLDERWVSRDERWLARR